MQWSSLPKIRRLVVFARSYGLVSRKVLSNLRRPPRATNRLERAERPGGHWLRVHEQVYLRSGRGWMLSRHKRELQRAWIAFANRYADGSFEFGSVCIGTRGWRFAAVIRSDG